MELFGWHGLPLPPPPFSVRIGFDESYVVGVCKEYHSKGDSGVKRTACGRGDQGKRRVRRSARAEDRRQLRG